MPTPLHNTEILRRLVGFDSVSRNSNLPIADFISDTVDRPGVRVRRQRSPDGTKTNPLPWLLERGINVTGPAVAEAENAA